MEDTGCRAVHSQSGVCDCTALTKQVRGQYWDTCEQCGHTVQIHRSPGSK